MSAYRNDRARAGWNKIGRHPPAGRSYLVAADYNGVRAYDVAFYRGLDPEGWHRWILGGRDINGRCIKFWREIESPWPDEAEGCTPS